MAEVSGAKGSYADELAQYQRLQNKFTNGDRGKADAEDLEAFKKLQERMAGGGVASDSKAGNIENAGSTSNLGLTEPVKKEEPPKTEAPPQVAPPKKKKKKNCLQKIGDALGKVAGFISKAVPVVASLMDAFKAFKGATDGAAKEKAGDAVISAAKKVGEAAKNGDSQAKLVFDAFKDTGTAEKKQDKPLVGDFPTGQNNNLA